jgi:hypothetical protein
MRGEQAIRLSADVLARWAKPEQQREIKDIEHA